jgi:hypothetical protein
MNRQLPLTATPVTPPPVWSGLPGDLQQRTVRLLAQLAYAHLRHQAPLSTQEIDHGRLTQQPQDSPRSS